MKKIISGKKKYYEIKDIKWVTVPLFDELTPISVLKALNLEENDKESWNFILELCPEICTKGFPKDRDFFFNILNTLKPECME